MYFLARSLRVARNGGAGPLQRFHPIITASATVAYLRFGYFVFAEKFIAPAELFRIVMKI